MKKILRIAQLSDIHCRKTSKVTKKIFGDWENPLDEIRNFLQKISDQFPDVIVITGDLVDTPKQRHFDEFRGKFISLFNDIKDKYNNNLKLLIVPGNHDYFSSGIFFWKKSKLFSKFKEKLYEDLGTTEEQTLKDIYQEFSVAFFPIDSNETKPGQLATGCVKNPWDTLNSRAEFYRKMDILTYNKCRKIILMHHHPISLGEYKKKTLPEILWHGTIALLNPQGFLFNVNAHNIDLIVHGHKHKSGEIIVGYPKSDLNMINTAISSCGSSCCTKEQNNEIKLIDIIDGLTCTITAYNRGVDDQRGFMQGRLVTFCFQNNNDNYNNNNDDLFSNGVRAKCKSKQVNIATYGGATTEVLYEGVSLEENENAPSIIEYINLDSGRYLEGQWAFDTRGAVLSDGERIWENILHPDMEKQEGPDPGEAEEFSFCFGLDKGKQDMADKTFALSYRQQNGYALSSEQHQDLYDWTDADTNDLQENCSIQTSLQLDKMDLTVRFPVRYFPKATSFTIKVFRKEEYGDSGLDYVILKGKLQREDEEEKRVKNNNSLVVKMGLSEVSMTVMKPRLDVIYSIHWEVPVIDYLEENSSYENVLIDELTDEFLNGTERVRNFMSELSIEMQQYFSSNTDGSSVSCFLIGFDSMRHQLKISVLPERLQDKRCRSFLVGRGIAGAAFTRRTVAYWDTEIAKIIQNIYQDDTEIDNNVIEITPEKIVEGLEPKAVFAFPILYPWDFDEILNNTLLEGDNRAYPLAVVSIVTESWSSPLFLSVKDYEAEEDVLTLLNNKINMMYMDINKIVDFLMAIHFYEVVEKEFQFPKSVLNSGIDR